MVCGSCTPEKPRSSESKYAVAVKMRAHEVSNQSVTVGVLGHAEALFKIATKAQQYSV